MRSQTKNNNYKRTSNFWCNGRVFMTHFFNGLFFKSCLFYCVCFLSENMLTSKTCQRNDPTKVELR